MKLAVAVADICALAMYLVGCERDDNGDVVDEGALRGSMKEWVAECRELALRPPDELIGSCEAHRAYKQDYEIVYYDKRFLSFRGIECWCEGGAHANTRVSAGVLDRKTGRLLKPIVGS